MLLDIVRIMNEADVHYYIDAGTLLGIVRDGDLIPWDYDMDMSVMAHDLESFRKTFWKLRMRGWRVSDNDYVMKHNDVAWNKGQIRSIKIRNRNMLFFGRGRVVMDVFVKYNKDDKTYWSFGGCVCQAPRHHHEGYDTVNYGGQPLKIPKDHPSYLSILYGDWKTPKKDWRGSRDDQSIIRKLGEYTG